MTETSPDGQADATLLARAIRALVEEGRLSVDGLLPAYRTHAPSEHAGARADALDVAFVQRARALGGDALLRARTLRVAPGAPRSAARVVAGKAGEVTLELAAGHDVAGTATALALGLSLEAAKLGHGLRPAPDVLRAAFATPNEARAAVEALERGGKERELVLADPQPRVDARSLALLVGDRPVYVVAGRGAWRIHDLVSPFVRRLRTDLATLGQARGGPRDDDVYLAADELLADPAVAEERLTVERADGILPLGDGAVAVKCEVLPDECDRRVREALVPLKRARALLVLVEAWAPSLATVLEAAGPACRAVALVLEATAQATPSFVHEITQGLVTPVANALDAAPDGARSLTTVPTFALLRSDAMGAYDTAAFPLVQAVLHAWSSGALPASTRLAVKGVPRDDVQALSSAGVELLLRLGPKKGR